MVRGNRSWEGDPARANLLKRALRRLLPYYDPSKSVALVAEL